MEVKGKNISKKLVYFWKLKLIYHFTFRNGISVLYEFSIVCEDL